MEFFLILLAIFQLGQAFSTEDSCSAEDIQHCGACTNMECEPRRDNIIGSFTSVMSSEECQDWCTRRNEYMNDCQYITYFGKEGLPVKNACYIFASCEKKSVCANCVTETSDCLCSSNNISKIENTNLLQNINIDTERDCRQKCRNYPSCEFYTYLNDSLECYLLSHLIEPFTICDGCRTGKANCTESPTTPATSVTTSTETTPSRNTSITTTSKTTSTTSMIISWLSLFS